MPHPRRAIVVSTSGWLAPSAPITTYGDRNAVVLRERYVAAPATKRGSGAEYAPSGSNVLRDPRVFARPDDATRVSMGP